MPCYFAADTIMCSRGRRAPAPCRTCSAPSLYLCDAPLGEATFGVDVRTCDAPMCEAHRTSVASNVDHCPLHVAVAVEVDA
jgi:hypothetical protein